MKSIFVLLICFFSTLLVYPQTTFERKIEWKEPRMFSYYYDFQDRNIDQKKFLYFKDAVFLDEYPGIPFYFELIEINSPNISIDVIDIKTESFTIEEHNVLDKNLLAKNIQHIQYSIQYQKNQPFISMYFYHF